MFDEAGSSAPDAARALPRRDFLKTSAGAAAALITGALPSPLDAVQNAAGGASRSFSQSKQSPSSLISVPKSGAVGGIGETFVPNPQTGTEGVSIPLPFTRGRDGFGPQLSLGYSVANGNGIFGLGWKLDLPDIARKTQGRLPRYDGEDAFLLDGAELRPQAGPAQERGLYDVVNYRLRH